MVIDVVTLALVILAKNEIAAKAFLRELTCMTETEDKGRQSYAHNVVMKATALVEGGRGWMEDLF